MQLDVILTKAVQVNASDVHLTVGLPPIFRINGTLMPLADFKILNQEDLCTMTEQILIEEEQHGSFKRNKQIDLAYSLPELSRFRVNISTQRGSIAFSIRVVNFKIPSIGELGLPASLEKLTELNSGLVLVTGPKGSGKSTTLAALIDKINRERSYHIVTIEDPIEFMHCHQKSIVNQREIGSDVMDFPSALKSALRQDPDVILLGEMSDLDTISTALTAAETGHLVFATLNSVNAPQTIERIIDVFPAYHQQQIRTQLINSLQAIISQQLLPVKDSAKQVVAVELLYVIPTIRNLIRENKIQQILSVMQNSGKYGMQTMDSALRLLYQKKIISKEELARRSQMGITN